MQVLTYQTLNKTPDATRAITFSQLLATKTLCDNIQLSWAVGLGLGEGEVSLCSAYKSRIQPETVWSPVSLEQLLLEEMNL